MPHRYNLALVLSGGVARGAAHLGIIKALFEQGIKPDIYIGSSIGAIIAAMMAIYDDVDFVIDKYLDFVERYSWLDLADIPLLDKEQIISLSGLMDGERMINLVEKETGISGLKLSQTKKPLYITATDLNSGEEIIFGYPQEFKFRKRVTCPPKPSEVPTKVGTKEGRRWKNYYQPVFYPKDIPIAKALRAAIGMPVLFKPYSMRLKNQKLALVDGGIRDNCPFRLAAYLPDVKYIVASVLGYAGEQKIDFNRKDLASIFFQFLDLSTAFSQVGSSAQDAIFSEKNAPIVRIINPGIFSVHPLALGRSRAIMLSAYRTLREIFGKFKDMEGFWKPWGRKEANYFSSPRWKLQKPGRADSNIFSLTDLKSPLEKELRKKSLKYRLAKLFK